MIWRGWRRGSSSLVFGREIEGREWKKERGNFRPDISNWLINIKVSLKWKRRKTNYNKFQNIVQFIDTNWRRPTRSSKILESSAVHLCIQVEEHINFIILPMKIMMFLAWMTIQVGDWVNRFPRGRFE